METIFTNFRMYRALVVVSCMAEADDFQRQLPSLRYPDLQFIYPNDISSAVMSDDKLLASCREVSENYRL